MNNTDNSHFKKYVIVYQDNGYGEYNRDLALYMQKRLSERGINIPIMSDSEEPVEYEILLGHTNRPESEAAYIGFFAPERMHYTIDMVGKKYVLAGYEWFSTKKAVDVVCDAMRSGKAPEDFRDRNKAMHTAAPERSGTYRALHYNVLVEWVNWGSGGILEGPVYKRREPLANIILSYSPDFICFCEVFERWATTLPELLGEQYSFIRLDRADTNGSNRTPLAYDKKKFRLIESAYENLPSVQSINYRVMTWGLLEERSTGKKLLVCGTHWDSTREESVRQKQALVCAEVVNELSAKYGAEVIFMGDFNTRTGLAAYDDLLTNCPLVDAEGDSRTDWSVDHIFVSKNIKVNYCKRESGKSQNYASDHAPVICDFDF